MKKIKMIAALSLASILLYGCAGGIGGNRAFDPGQSSIYLGKDGSLKGAVVQEYSKDGYAEEELKGFAEKEVVAYNKEKGKAESAYNQSGASEKLPVAIETCTLKNSKATLIFSYGSVEDMLQFSAQSGDTSNTISGILTATTADVQGIAYLAEGTMLDKDGKAVPPGEITKQNLTIAVIEGGATILTESKIMYRSENVTLTDNNTVTTAEGGRYIIVY